LAFATPMTSSRTDDRCLRNSSKQGTDTTRAETPRSRRNFRASTAMQTSEPVANSETSATLFPRARSHRRRQRIDLSPPAPAAAAQILAGERENAGAARARDGELPALGRFHTVAGAEHEQTGWHAVPPGVDRLMRRTVLAEPDGVAGHHEYDAIAHERRGEWQACQSEKTRNVPE
jgi:hypothetical protein